MFRPSKRTVSLRSSLSKPIKRLPIPVGRFSLWLTFTKKVEHLTPEQLHKWESDGLPSHATLDASVFTREILLGRFLDTQIPAPVAPLMDDDATNSSSCIRI